MTFLEAINSGKKIRSEYWSDEAFIDTKVFSDKLDDADIYIFSKAIKPIEWKEIFGDWYFV